MELKVIFCTGIADVVDILQFPDVLRYIGLSSKTVLLIGDDDEVNTVIGLFFRYSLSPLASYDVKFDLLMIIPDSP